MEAAVIFFFQWAQLSDGWDFLNKIIIPLSASFSTLNFYHLKLCLDEHDEHYEAFSTR